ncbi:glutamate--cysteine ligase [Saccharospirillum mangrovi]|uniref:glutamate--cysteine ligase n=1 Tax=Saccharospirillum mangrovi TaxID=2161747 RepID=UPI0013005E2A|nr:glutamate--cysteine ligase [Saccharospirillum mangrovi]
MPTLTRLGQLTDLNPAWLKFNRGIERETLRATPTGDIAQTAHPAGLGSALTHSSITTDYSESLLEFITGIHDQPEGALAELGLLHRFALTQLNGEQLWPASMPTRLPAETEIPIAQYGSSHIGRLKTIYRHGLWHRYGRIMQTIAGVHYNWSMPGDFWADWAQRSGWDGPLQAFINREYFSLIRGFRRHSWLLLYLFGASPAADRSFLPQGSSCLEPLGDDTLFGPYATSLRMSDLGYSNSAQSSLYVCFNSLETYAETLSEAIHTPYPRYEAIGTKVNGEYRQLSTAILQIENEYYSDLRPKRVAHSGEKPIHALNERGVEYIEVRCLDVDPFTPYGIDVERMRFVDLFLFWCLVQDNGLIQRDDCFRLRENNQRVAAAGRDPKLELVFNGQAVGLREQGQRVLDSLATMAVELDALAPGSGYAAAVEAQRSKILNADLTPSARFLEQIRAAGSYRQASMALAEQHALCRKDDPSDQAGFASLNEAAKTSLAAQQRMEAESDDDFDGFLSRYLRQ